jgi:hypothetical protein
MDINGCLPQLTTSELSLQEGEAEFGLQLLRTLLGDSVDTARIQSASILVALRHLNDLLGQLQVATYDRQESEVSHQGCGLNPATQCTSSCSSCNSEVQHASFSSRLCALREMSCAACPPSGHVLVLRHLQLGDR